MKLKLSLLLVSFISLVTVLFQGKNALSSMSLEITKRQQFSELLPIHIIFPSFSDIKILFLSEEDKVLFNEYVDVVTPYVLSATFFAFVTLVVLVAILISIINSFYKRITTFFQIIE